MLPDENDLDFRRSVIDDGGGVLLTSAVQDLTVDLDKNSHHVLPSQPFLSVIPSKAT